MRILNAIPEKRIFLSIISEYDLRRSICELIDNAIDLWTKHKRGNLVIKIHLDETRQTISIEDNAGGIEEAKLDHIISPGKTSNDIKDDVIGYFGVGSKRAVIALAEDVTIHSRFEKQEAFAVHFDDHWITDDPKWELPYDVSKKQLPACTTIIELFKLRTPITEDEINNLQKHLSEVYGDFLKLGAEIFVNGNLLKPIFFDENWTYAANYSPTTFKGQIPLEDRKVEVEITSGLMNQSGDRDNSYGVFFYCNNRLIARGVTDFTVGFVQGILGMPHYNISLVRTIVRLKGQSRDMPWNSSKSGIDTKHRVFQTLRNIIIDSTKTYVQICRSLQGKWEEELFRHKKGKIKTEDLQSFKNIPKTFLPTPPPSKPRWPQKVKSGNSSIIADKPWAEGLQDSIIAADLVSNTSLSQKNRISLIVLDSTLEIAYKDYLVNEQGMGAKPFKNICENRADVQKEVFKTITVTPATLKKINYYYKLRCDLIHQRVTPNISDQEIDDYRKIVEMLLNKMFGLNFNY